MNLMHQDNPVHIFLNTLGDLICANLLFLLCCIPLITLGPALTALYHCTLRIAKGNLNGVCKTFFRAFRENFVQSVILWLGLLSAGLLLSVNIRFLQQMPGSTASVLFYLCGALIALLVILFLYSFPVLAAFSNTLLNLLRNALLFAFTHFPATLLIAAVTLLPMYMTYHDLKLLPLYAFCWFFFGFALTAYVNSLLFYRMFRPFLPEDKEGDEKEGETPENPVF